MALYSPIPLRSASIHSPFFLKLNDLIRRVTLPAVIDSLKKTGRFYALSWTKDTAPHDVHCFWDSDAYKVMEACCYHLINQEDPKIRQVVEEYAAYVKRAQWTDGYVNSFYTIHEPGKRFTNLRDMHELYCLGHLAEFAVAYQALTGSFDLIEVVRRFVELLHKTIIPLGGYPGHQELELALVRVYEITRDRFFLDTAGYFITERGRLDANGQIFYDRECVARGIDPNNHLLNPPPFRKPRDYAYMQAAQPLVEQEEIDGHCVRAVYFLTGAYHYALHSGQESNDAIGAVLKLFDDVTSRKMYITGGLGSVSQNEGFGPPYHLPDLRDGGGCYSETCASFGLIMLSDKLLRHKLRGCYADVIERALLNCVMGALGLDGASFFYENPLATVPERPWHRSRWFDTSCCPPNIVKIWGLLPELISSTRGCTVAIHQYISSTLEVTCDNIKSIVSIESKLPWAGDVSITTRHEQPFDMALRIPAWTSSHFSSSVQGRIEDGYLYVRVLPGQKIDLNFSTAPRVIHAHPLTRKDEVAVMRGPLVYCAEGVDNSFNLEDIYIPNMPSIVDEESIDIMCIPEVPIIKMPCFLKCDDRKESELYSNIEYETVLHEKMLRLVPYFARENRGGNGAMRVWFRKLHPVHTDSPLGLNGTRIRVNGGH